MSLGTELFCYEVKLSYLCPIGFGHVRSVVSRLNVMYDTLPGFRYLILIILPASRQVQSGAKIYLQNLSREYVRQITNIFPK